MNQRSDFPDRVNKAVALASWCLGVLLCALLSGRQLAFAQGAGSIDAWRTRVGEARTLAENDAPSAYEEALRLRDALPPDAPPADRVRLLNLLARIEIYLAQTERSAEHVREAFELASRHGDKLGQAEADINSSLNSVNEGRIDNLVTVTTRSLTELEGANRPDLIGEALLRTTAMSSSAPGFKPVMKLWSAPVPSRLARPLSCSSRI